MELELHLEWIGGLFVSRFVGQAEGEIRGVY
jgi:hypothetical protein